MPQMSPLSWSWMILVIIFSFYLMMVGFFFVFSVDFVYGRKSMMLNEMIWMW